MMSNLLYTTAALLIVLFNEVNGHGYLASPRSRNLVAYEDGKWSGGADLPEKENCPACANTKNAAGFCGKVETRDYDAPKKGNGSLLGPMPQASWTEGQYVDLDFVYTANHKGHHVMYGCPDFDNPSRDCFDKYKFEFIEDLSVEIYGNSMNAPKDDNYPERVYVDPNAKYVRHRYKLPDGLFGDSSNDNLVLLQWHWLTGNSCVHEGYDDYDFPPGWSPGSLGQCTLPYSETGVQVPPEQFWNCADVQIKKAGDDGSPTTTKAPTKMPTIAPSVSSGNDTSAPTSKNSGCCSKNYKTCDATYCGNSKEKCLSCSTIGDTTWLPNGDHAATCIPRNGDCSSEGSICCDVGEGHAKLMCLDGTQSGTKECVVSGVTSAPTKAPIQGTTSSPTKSITSTPTKSPIVSPTGPSPGSCSDDSMSVRLGYFQSWAQWRPTGCEPVNVHNVNAEGYTHLVYSFAKVGADLLISPWHSSDTNEYVDFNKLKDKYPALKTLIAIGGWSHNDPGELQSRFSDMAATEENRVAFADSVVTFLSQYGFDGLDLDWEYPGAPDRGGSAVDTQNYVLLCEELRRKFDAASETYLLTMATPIGHYSQYFDYPGLATHLDWINVMSYDIHGYWDDPKVVGMHTDMRKIKANLAQYYAGVSSEKLVLGLGSYGRSYTLASTTCNTPGCAFSAGSPGTSCTSSPGYIGYFELKKMIDSNDFDVNVYHEESGSMYLSRGSFWASYDNAFTFAIKREYASDSCMLGVMEWAMDMSQGNNPLVESGPVAPPAPTVPTTPAPQSPTPEVGTCGGGSVGNGVCQDTSLCCSEWGWCGTSSSHCTGTGSPVTASPTKVPTKGSTSAPTKAPTKIPETALPTKNLRTSSPTKSPTKKPTTSSPTKSPVQSPGSNACCTYDYKTCTTGWCNESESNCAQCTGNWLPNGPETQCLAKWTPCHNSDTPCCGSTQCIGSQWYKQCT